MAGVAAKGHAVNVPIGTRLGKFPVRAVDCLPRADK
jgi:hypothetical protein